MLLQNGGGNGNKLNITYIYIWEIHIDLPVSLDKTPSANFEIALISTKSDIV